MEESRETAAGPVFELDAGALCLDFANTVEDRPQGSSEKLESYADLLAFAAQAESLAPPELEALGRRACRRPGAAAAVFTRALALRECLYRIFSALAAGDQPADGDLRHLNGELAEALARLRLAREGEGFGWRWSAPRDDLERPLWPLARSAADLLAAEHRDPIRECASESCSWLFLDRSRNRSRRWCDMTTCGNRAKAQRYYRRHKGPHHPPDGGR